jgi:hypothetical protein
MVARGKIILAGFKLEQAEKAIVDNLIRNYKDKINERIGFKEIKLRMKKSARGKAFLHEVQGTLITDKRFNTKVTDYNLFAALAETFEKLMHEAEHNQRTKRQESRKLK